MDIVNLKVNYFPPLKKLTYLEKNNFISYKEFKKLIQPNLLFNALGKTSFTSHYFYIFTTTMKLRSILFITIFVVLFSGCKQDFDITSKYKETPVVYALLNANETTHYIRIQKGFLIDGNALLAAGISDSIYYADLTVKLIPYSGNNPTGLPILFTKIDGDTLSPPIRKDSGTFTSSPNILYRYKGLLSTTKRYKLEITNNSNGNTITTLPNENPNDIGTGLVSDFLVSTPTYNTKINLRTINAAKVVWDPATNGGIYDLTIRFPYREFNQSDNSLKADTFIDILVFKSLIQTTTGGSKTAEVPGTLILSGLAAKLSADISVYREFNKLKGMRFTFQVGGTDYQKFVVTQQVQGGISANEAISPYSNIAGGEGLFSSRFTKHVDSVLLTDPALDTLSCSILSKNLRFKNHTGQICN